MDATRTSGAGNTISDFISPNQSYSLQDLGIGVNQRTATLYVESISSSIELGDQKIQVDVSTCRGLNTHVTDQVRLTALPEVFVNATKLDTFASGGADGEFTIYRKGLLGQSVVVNYRVGGTAVAGYDYVALSGSVVIPANEDRATVSVHANSGANIPDEYASVDLTVLNAMLQTGASPSISAAATPLLKTDISNRPIPNSKAADVVIAAHPGVVSPQDVDGFILPEFIKYTSGSPAAGYTTKEYQILLGKAYASSNVTLTDPAAFDAIVAQQSSVGRIIEQARYDQIIGALRHGDSVKIKVASLTEDPVVSQDVRNENNSVGAPGKWESIIPLWGNSRKAIHDFQTGNLIWSIINAGLAISDVVMLKSLGIAGYQALVRAVPTAAEIAAKQAMMEEVAAALASMGAEERAIAEVAGVSTHIADDAARQAHKANAWADYQEVAAEGKNANYNYQKWSNVYESNQVQALRANVAAESYRSKVGFPDSQFTVDVEGEARRLDMGNLQQKIGVEYKTGYQSLTKTGPRGVGGNLWELERDSILIKKGWSIKWVFENGTASKPLLNALDAVKITAFDQLGNPLNITAGLVP